MSQATPVFIRSAGDIRANGVPRWPDGHLYLYTRSTRAYPGGPKNEPLRLTSEDAVHAYNVLHDYLSAMEDSDFSLMLTRPHNLKPRGHRRFAFLAPFVVGFVWALILIGALHVAGLIVILIAGT